MRTGIGRWLGPVAVAAVVAVSAYAAWQTLRSERRAAPAPAAAAGAVAPNLRTSPQENPLLKLPHPFVGKAAPAFTWTGLDGRPLSLAGFKGKPVVLVYFTTW